jgi:hypothetical protein
MIIFFLKRLISKWTTWAVIVAIILCYWRQSLIPIYITSPVVISRYTEFIAVGYMSLLFPPLYCFWISDNCHMFNDTKFILRMQSRLGLMLRYALCTMINAASFAIIINLIVLPIVIIKNGNILSYLSYFACSYLLQILYFAVCSFLFFAVYLLANKIYLSFVVVILYGFWDFIGSSLFSKWVYIGSAHALIDSATFLKNPTSVLINVRFFLAFVIILCVLCAFACSKRDFIGNNEGKSYE